MGFKYTFEFHILLKLLTILLDIAEFVINNY